MKLWMSSEAQADVGDVLAAVQSDVTSAVNAAIESQGYGDGVKEWDVITMVTPWRDDSQFPEVRKLKRKSGRTEFRIRTDHQRFKKADDRLRHTLVMQVRIGREAGWL